MVQLRSMETEQTYDVEAPEGPCWPVAWVYEFAYCLRRGYYAWVEGPGEPVALSSGEGTWMAADGWCGPVQFIRDGHGSPVPVIRLAHMPESDTAERPEHLMLAALARLIEVETGQSVVRGIVQYGPTGRQEVVTWTSACGPHGNASMPRSGQLFMKEDYLHRGPTGVARPVHGLKSVTLLVQPKLRPR